MIACSNCFIPSRSLVKSEIARGRISAGSCSWSTASAGSFIEVTRTRLPSAR